ncbi:MAG TPA: hypothetical protein VFV64_01880 [Permianibacter sp.]|nr:hypothetical protein [Permianibacter sp.]
MMWLMFRPSTAQGNADTGAGDGIREGHGNEPTRFNERELALLAELLQARSTVQQKRMDSMKSPHREERAA